MRILATVLAVLWACQVHAKTWVVPPEHRGGGNFLKYWNLAAEIEQQGYQIVIPQGGCTSACTLFLLADRVCVHPQAVFEFHGPQSNWAAVVTQGIPLFHGMDKEHRDRLNRFLALAYELRWPGLGEWYLDHAAHLYGMRVAKRTGQSLHDTYDIPLC